MLQQLQATLQTVADFQQLPWQWQVLSCQMQCCSCRFGPQNPWIVLLLSVFWLDPLEQFSEVLESAAGHLDSQPGEAMLLLQSVQQHMDLFLPRFGELDAEEF